MQVNQSSLSVGEPLISMTPPSPGEFTVESKYHPLALRCIPFGKDVCLIKLFGPDQVLAWTSNQMAMVGVDGEIRCVMQLPKGETINKVLFTGNSSFVVLSGDKKAYRFDKNTAKFTDISLVKSTILPETFSVVEGKAAWASKKKSIVLIGESGEMIFKAKLPNYKIKNEQITAITSLGKNLIAVGTSHGHIAVFNQTGNLVQSHCIAEGNRQPKISRLIGDEHNHLAVELPDRVVVITDVLNSQTPTMVEPRASLMSQGRSLHDNRLLIKYEKSNSTYMPPIAVWNLENENPIMLEEPKFWAGSHAEFTVDGNIIGGGGSDYRPLRVWDALTGKCIAETLAVQVSSVMDQSILGFALCKSFDEHLGLVNVAEGHVTRFSNPQGVKITGFAHLSDHTIVATGNDGGIYMGKAGFGE